MNETLEHEVAEAFRYQSSRVPPEAVARVGAVDYRPRARRGPLRAVGTLAGAGAASGAIVSAVVLSGSQAAFAGWTPDPTAASATQETSASSDCQAQLASSPLFPSEGGAGWAMLASDVRGPFTVAIYKDGTVDATCFTGPSFTVIDTIYAGTGGGPAAQSGSISQQVPGTGTGSATPSAGSGSSISTEVAGPAGLEYSSVAHLESTADGPYTMVEGKADADVSAVTLVRSDGEDVQATVAGGMFVAWWPGSLDATSAEVTTPGGTASGAITWQPFGGGPGTGASPGSGAPGTTPVTTGA